MHIHQYLIKRNFLMRRVSLPLIVDAQLILSIDYKLLKQKRWKRDIPFQAAILVGYLIHTAKILRKPAAGIIENHLALNNLQHNSDREKMYMATIIYVYYAPAHLISEPTLPPHRHGNLQGPPHQKLYNPCLRTY